MFKLQFETDNAAFGEDPTGFGRGEFGRNEEIARILRDVADKIASDHSCASGICRDANGNRVGAWALDIEESV